MKTELQLLRHFLRHHPEDTARLLERAPVADAAAIIADAEREAAASALRYMAPPFAAGCLSAMPAENAAALLEKLPIDNAASLLRRLQSETSQPILDGLPESLGDAFRKLLRFPENTAGAIMDPTIHVVAEDARVGEVLRQVRQAPQSIHFDLPVVNRRDVLTGSVDLARLTGASPNDKISALMSREIIGVYAYATLESLEDHPGWKILDSLPVVDEAGVVVGAIRHREWRKAVESEDRGPDHEGPMIPLLSLGEAYWKGMAALLGGALGMRSVVRREEVSEGDQTDAR